jgi:hypothetical protein
VKIQILYQTQYSYAEPVSFSLHLFRLFPRTERHVTVRSTQFQTNIGARLAFVGTFSTMRLLPVSTPGNPRSSRRSPVALDGRKKRLWLLLEARALDLPFDYSPEEAQVLCALSPRVRWNRSSLLEKAHGAPAHRRDAGGAELRHP